MERLISNFETSVIKTKTVKNVENAAKIFASALRDCEEISEPVQGEIKGKIPEWIQGNLLKNGPGRIKYGETELKHLFDGAALLHRFNIENGLVTYQNKFLRSEVYQKSVAANRLVMNEFGTVAAVPDPCQSTLQRFSSFFQQSSPDSDNAAISICPFNDEIFAFGEGPKIHKIDQTNLKTLERVDVSEKFGIVHHTAHPHVLSDGTVYNVGLIPSKKGISYAIMCFPKGEMNFDEAFVAAKVSSTRKLFPAYMHSFGITENYFVLVEQPLTLSIPSIFRSKIIKQKPLISALKYFKNEKTFFHVVSRKLGKIERTFEAEGFAYFHVINQYEKDENVVIDICASDNPEILNSLYIETIKNPQKNQKFEKSFKSLAMRFVLPMNSSKRKILCLPEILSNLSCEFPRINNNFLGTKYRYFYALNFENPKILIKVDVDTKESLTFEASKALLSEPIFVPSPRAQSEDDGVVLASMIFEEENKVGLLVLDARNMSEIARCEFENLPSAVPLTFHGWFIKN